MIFISLIVLLLRLHVSSADFACPSDFELFNGKCYSFQTEAMDALNANVVCLDLGAQMVSIHSEEEAAFISSSHLGYESWIGLICNLWDENWEWSDYSPVDYTNFEDRNLNTENCEAVSGTLRFGLRDDLQWWPREWNDSLNFTCERQPINCPDGFDFLTNTWCFSSNATVKMDYGNATEYCAAIGAYLPSAESTEVTDALMTEMADLFWIGLECSLKNTTWFWSDHVCYYPSQASFVDTTGKTNCNPYSSNKYAMNLAGKWAPLLYNTTLHSVICVTAALLMPTEPPDIAYCPPGYAKFRGPSPEEDWCFAMNHPLPLDMDNSANYTAAKDFCMTRGELLPIVTSSQMAIFLRSIRASFDILRKNPFWIALECEGDGSYVWYDGTTLDPNYRPWYNNTEDQCEDDFRVVFNPDGNWENVDASEGQKLIICAVRASTSTAEPTRPTQPESPDCPPGMHELTEKWCGVYSEQGSYTWSLAANYCAVSGYGSLPSVENAELADALALMRQDYIGTDQAPFWIGLECAPDNQEFDSTGIWSWLDGTPWNDDYVMFVSWMDATDNCTLDDTRFVFTSLERWNPIGGEANELPFVLCTAPKVNWFTTVTTESPAPLFRCDLGWLELSPGLCYTISQLPMNYTDAKDTCADMGTQLPSIQSRKTTNAFMDVMKHLGEDHVKAGFWLGLECDDDGNFVWTDGAEFSYANFPDVDTKYCDLDSSETYFVDWHGDWTKSAMSDVRYAVCEKGAYEEVSTAPPVLCPGSFSDINGQCFEFKPLNASTLIAYEQAIDSCSTDLGHLPSISDPMINAMVELDSSGKSLWLGMHCEKDNYAWDDRTPMLYQNFDPYQSKPNCERLNDDLAIVFSIDGFWRAENRTNQQNLLACMTQGQPYTPTSPKPPPTTTTPLPTTKPTTTTTKKSDDTDEPSSDEPTDAPDHSTKATTHKTTTVTVTDPPPARVQWWMYIVIGIAVILAVMMLIFLGQKLYRGCKRKHAVQTTSVAKIFEEAEVASRKKSTRYAVFPKKEDDWEIDRRFVLIDYDTRLGQGAFGSVFQGRVLHKNLPPGASRSIMEMSALKKGNDLVAVKMLHESADKSAEFAFRDEIGLMKTIGYHERLVNMLACVADSEPVMLILEYCPHGDLLQYMRKRRMYMLEHPADQVVDTSMIISQKKQLMHAMQIAYGLEYLSSRGFVHRDIAARNILVDHNETCKIGDFGLCRVMGKESEHYHSRGGRLPLKWMSPEAIAKYDFTPASDVWSFGVLLFEIITLGGTPYPDWAAAELLQRLKRGERMERPDNCTDAMHELMNECWKADTEERPVFSTIRKKIAMQLDQVSPDEYYLKLNAQANYYAASSQLGEEDAATATGHSSHWL